MIKTFIVLGFVFLIVGFSLFNSIRHFLYKRKMHNKGTCSGCCSSCCGCHN